MAPSRGERTRVYSTIGPGGTESPAGSHRQSVVENLRHSCAVTRLIAEGGLSSFGAGVGAGVREAGGGAPGAGGAGSPAGAGVASVAGVGVWRGDDDHGRQMRNATASSATTPIARVAGAGDAFPGTGGDGDTGAGDGADGGDGRTGDDGGGGDGGGGGGGAGALSATGVLTAGFSIGRPCARQKSSRFCRLATTIGSSGASDADAIATARR